MSSPWLIGVGRNVKRLREWYQLQPATEPMLLWSISTQRLGLLLYLHSIIVPINTTSSCRPPFLEQELAEAWSAVPRWWKACQTEPCGTSFLHAGGEDLILIETHSRPKATSSIAALIFCDILRLLVVPRVLAPVSGCPPPSGLRDNGRPGMTSAADFPLTEVSEEVSTSC